MTKVIKATVEKAPARAKDTQTSRGAEYPWQVWDIDDGGFYTMAAECDSEQGAQEHAAGACDEDTHPVIVHIDIPPMEY